MIRQTLIALALSAPIPAAAQDAATDPLPRVTEAPDAVFECTQAGEGVACTVDTEAAFTFCMALDAAGEPLANSTGASDSGEVIFQDIDAAEVASVRCRNV